MGRNAVVAEQKLNHGSDICFVNADTNLAKSQYNHECSCTFLSLCYEIIRSVLPPECPLAC